MTNANQLLSLPAHELLARFQRDGFILVEGLFDSEEIDLLKKIGRADHRLQQEAMGRRDGEGGVVRLTVRNELENNIYGAFVRCRRIVDTMERLLEGEVYHYHHKMILKEPKVGGAWEWHQDYGYWYDNGCLFPYMASCMIAVDRATPANGCLQVLKGSHLMGRIDHGKVGDQTGADPERVAAALERLERVDCVLDPGSAIFFHSNLLHRSDQNRSEHPRWALICCYNAARNDPYKESKHPRYHQLEKWEDSRIKEIGRVQWAETQRVLNESSRVVHSA
ncbi:MAG: proline hydroxylase [Planctomycetes bacterium SCN 63-9]|nr:MAG: proline hydroxylase [Planctomycetes bacterium SCN 63-9]